LLDIGGLTRPVSKTLNNMGCDEFTTGTLTNHQLSINEVGFYYMGILGTSSLNYENKIGIGVYPNPVKSKLFFQFLNREANIKTIILSTILGEAALILNKVDMQVGIDIANLGNGIYFIRFIDDKNQLICVKKIIKN